MFLIRFYIRGPIKGYIQPYYIYYPTVTRGGGSTQPIPQVYKKSRTMKLVVIELLHYSPIFDKLHLEMKT